MAYIYEHIRTRGVEPLNFEEHYLRLDALMNELFFAHLSISREELRKRICSELQSRGYSPRAINAVCVKIEPFRAEPTIEIEEIFYERFALRAIRPKGFIYRVGGDLILEKSSAREALLELNRSMARATDDSVAIWENEKGEIVAIDGASVIAVFDDEIRFSTSGNGVEFDLAFNAMVESVPNVTRGPIFEADLTQAKEILAIDHRGIAVLESFDDHYYMDITAIRIAEKVAEAELA